MRMSQADIMAIDAWVATFPTDLPFTFVELGVWQGGWEQRLRARFDDNLYYYGIDSCVEPGSQPSTITMDTLDAADKVPDLIDVLLIDACHCERHVRLDFWLYAPKVRRGGGVIFHDTAKSVQGIADPGCAWGQTLEVGKAIDALFPHHFRPGWRLEVEQPGQCGVKIYARD